MYEKNFINDCLYGTAEIEDIDDYIEMWHQGQSNLDLATYLGMTPEEYGAWVQQNDSVLRDILRCRMDGITFGAYKAMSGSERIAARSTSMDDIKKIQSDNDDEQ